MEAVRPEHLRKRLAAAVAAGVTRVLVAGGDGTVESAASALVGTPVALAILPGGTLNHFARDHAIPTDPQEALEVARRGVVGTVDVGYLNDSVFINTSSVGAYVRFVRWRDRIEPYVGYRLASMLAGVRVLLRWPLLPVTLQVEGVVRHYRTPLVFVGVGERNLALSGFGQRVSGGGRGLYVILPHGRRHARRFARAYGRTTRGLPCGQRKIGLDTALVQQFRLDLPSPRTHVATDGEIVPAHPPLAYRFARDALRVVLPEDAAAGYARTEPDAR